MSLNKNIKIGKKEISLKKIILIISGVILLLIIGLTIIGAMNKVKPLYDDKYQPIYIEENNLENIYSNAKKYKGQFIDLSGQVFNIKTEEGLTLIQINADVDNSEKNTLIYIEGKTEIKNDDYVKITGYILGNTEYSNALGGKVSAPTIMATKLEKSNYMDVARPTIKEVKYSNKVIDQNGYKIEINKVEFAEQETRVYISASNNTANNFSIYTYSAVIIQNGKQHDVTYNYNYDEDLELQSELKPGITSEGILVFKALEQKDFNLILEVNTNNWDIDLNDFNFNLEIK